MEINNNLLKEVPTEPINSSQLSYTGQAEKDRLVRLVTDKKSASNSQCIYNEMPALKKAPKPHGKGKNKQIKKTNPSSSKNILNIQLLYKVNQAIALDIWDGNFYSVSLHSSMEHLMSDAINIKESLCRMMKYILNKKVEKGKANNVNDFKDIGKVAWNFILSLYKLE